MRGQPTTIDEVIPDFLWDKAHGSAQLDEGKALFSQVKDSLKTYMEVLSDPFSCP